MSIDRETEEFLLFAAQPARDGAYWYVPKQADVERASDGRPQLSLISTGNGGYLMLTARWGATEAALATLRAALAEQLEGTALPDTLELTPAPITVAGCRLLLGPDAEHVEALAFSKTSGMAAFSALFNQPLSAPQFDLAESALRGGGGVLAVEYEATLKRSWTIRASFRAVSDGLCGWLRERQGTDAEELRAALEEAIRLGLAVVEVELPPEADAASVSSLYESVLERVIAVVPAWLEQGAGAAGSELAVSVSKVQHTTLPVRVRGDLAKHGSPELVRSFNSRGVQNAAD